MICQAPPPRVLLDRGPYWQLRRRVLERDGGDARRAGPGRIWKYTTPNDTVCHATKEYARGDVHTNTAESSHALVKRGIVGIYHNVSREYLHGYLWQFDFMWNHRKLNDGERTILAVKAAEGKRLTYRDPINQSGVVN